MYLNCHSYFSLLYGTYSPTELVDKAKRMGVEKIILTDINITSGFYEVYLDAQKVGIEVIPGVEFRNAHEVKYIAIAQNPYGLEEINRHLSDHLLRELPYPDSAPEFKKVSIIYPLASAPDTLRENEWIGIKYWELGKLYKKDLDPKKIVAWHPVTFEDKIKFNLHRLLRSIHYNTLLSKLPKAHEADSREVFLSPENLEKAFESYPNFIDNARTLVDGCTYTLQLDDPKNLKVYKSQEKDEVILRDLGEVGLLKRYGRVSPKIRERFESELKTIKAKQFFSYYLITWDIIRFAKSRGYHHVGRGSGANSLVAYCIGITDVDPMELDLYFERFINLHRTSPPDFDIDFSWDERDEIIRYVFQKYGPERVALLATVTTFQGRSPYRELGKVFGLPKHEIDDILNNPGGDYKNEHTKYVFYYAPLLRDFPVNLSIHAGGIIISDRPIFRYTALQPMPKGFPVVQFDMYTAESIGFAKFDILSQRGLGHIKSCVDIVKENHGRSIDIHDVETFKKDPKVRQQLINHETMGCFYIESPAMRQLIWKLRCDNYLTLVAASSIIRPGVSSSGMMGMFIKYHHDPSLVTYLHPKMEELMKETYGIMVYQEDVIKVAHHFAGLSLAEADVLRRGMSGKSRSKAEFEKIARQWFENCQEKGYTQELATEVWRQIESFSGYSFSKAHSASYAVESYQSLYLKTYYPLEFMVAVINNFGGFYDTDLYIREARRYGAEIQAPDVNQSLYLTRILGTTLWIGFIHVKSLEQGLAQRLIQDRERNGPYFSLYDFYQRVRPGIEQLSILIKMGAFRGFGKDKKELFWEAYYYIQNINHEDPGLFEITLPKFKLPEFKTTPIEDRYDEIELLGFTLTPAFNMVQEDMGPVVSSTHFPLLLGKTIVIYGYLANQRVLKTKNRKLMAFGYFLDRSDAFFDATLFPQVFEKFPFAGKGVYRIEGKVVVEYGFHSIEVISMHKCSVMPDPRA